MHISSSLFLLPSAGSPGRCPKSAGNIRSSLLFLTVVGAHLDPASVQDRGGAGPAGRRLPFASNLLRSRARGAGGGVSG